MARIIKRTTKLFNSPYLRRNGFLVLFIMLALPLTVVLVQTQTRERSLAAGEVTYEVENATLSGNVAVANDSLASGGKYIIFSKETVSPTLTQPPVSNTPTPVSPTNPPPTGLNAFPGAVGYGKNTTGGRGGRVIYVTNLNDDKNPGSLRYALTEVTGPRTILFKVSGTIDLNDMIEVGPANGNLTIAGQTAPQGGVQIKGGMIKFTTKNVIVRYLKVRPGGTVKAPSDEDAIALQAYAKGEEVANIIIDHSTLTWGTDLGGIAMLKNVHDVTISNSILGEGMMLSNHGDVLGGADGHSMALSIFNIDESNGYGRNITIYNNLLTTSNKRMPEISGAEYLDFINNVIYNWRDTGPNGNPRKMNFMNNKILPGPMSTKGPYYIWRPTDLHNGTTIRPNAVYEAGNSYEERAGVKKAYGGARKEPAATFVTSPFILPALGKLSVDRIVTPDELYTSVINGNIGASLPVRDRADNETLERLRTGTGVFFNAETESQLPHPQWPDLTTVGVDAQVDSDNDGMGDQWERDNFGGSLTGSQSTPESSKADADGDGYTDLEEYLNKTNPNVKN